MPSRVLTFLLAAFVLPGAAAGQVLTGTITGRALDASGSVLPGVDVTIASPSMIGGPRSAVTDEQGVYRFTQLPSGDYQVTFKLAGFKTLTVTGVRVDVGATMTLNGTRQIDAVSESVTVVSDAPVIDLQSTQVGVNWDEKQLEERPYGAFTRMLTVPQGIDAESIRADFADGVLTLHVPKPETAKPKKIAIGHGAERKAIGTSS